MGYDFHITRRQGWWDEGSDITADEWLAYVATDPQLRLDPKTDFVTIDIKCSYPEPWLEWREGYVYTKNPDEHILAKMLQIASALGARVQGDEGEFYRSADFSDTYFEK